MGIFICISVPLPSWLFKFICPLWYLTICFTMDRPKPEPPSFLERLLSTI